jgi:hypothetical protein
MGSNIPNDAEFTKRLDNAASLESSEICAKRNILDVDATKKSTFSIVSPN